MNDIVCKRCGTEGFYFEEKKGPHSTAVCSNCGSYIKHLPKIKDMKIPFGKHEGRLISSMTSKQDLSYLSWMIDNDVCKGSLRSSIMNHLNSK